jgi:cytochrome c peroxidase
MTTRTAALGLIVLAFAGCRVASSASDGGADAGAVDSGPVDAGPHALCVNGQSVDGVYPKVPFAMELGGTVADLSFDGLNEQSQPATLALHDYYEPCAARSHLLMVRVSGAWCGTCRWEVSTHAKDLAESDIGDRLLWLDLLLANDDNAPPTLADAAAWRTKIDHPGRVAIDPAYVFGALSGSHEPLPLTAVIDTRTMQILYATGDSEPALFDYRLRQELAGLDKSAPPARPTPTLYDGLFSSKQWDLIRAITLPVAPPPDPTNAFADDANAAALGAQLFSDTTLSPGAVSCATCHDPAKQFTDGLPQSRGAVVGDRNAPSVLLASHSRWQFWDGRADSLWMQALGPIENEKEMNSSRLALAHAVFDRDRAAYEQLFGALPDLSDISRFPLAGKPGDVAWNGMTTADQKAITRVYVNVGKSIAAFERTLRVQPNRLDAYVGGDLTALTTDEKLSLQQFLGGGCMQCHYGPRLTDDAFHVVRFPTGRQDGLADRGRIDVVSQLLLSEFNAAGEYSDAPANAHGLTGLAASPTMLGAFKTPTLRGIAGTQPFGHGGSLATLQDVVRTYSTGGLLPGNPAAIGAGEDWMPRFGSGHIPQLLPFLQVLKAEPVQR